MKFSILTPTYNRAYTLQRLYDSICNQSIKNKKDLYEWIVVDDGSFDGTEKLVQSFIAEGKIKIKYFFQDNSGKPTAINNGVVNSSGEYIFIVDSDDVLAEDAISTLIDVDILASNDFNDKLSGFCFRKADLKGGVLGREVMGGDDYKLMTATECGNFFLADLAYVFKRAYLYDNKFPKFSSEKFVPELYVWNKITDIKPVLVFPKKVIYLCEYMNDGLSKNFTLELKNNPQGFGLFYKDQIKREKSFVAKLKKMIRWSQCQIYLLCR